MAGGFTCYVAASRQLLGRGGCRHHYSNCPTGQRGFEFTMASSNTPYRSGPSLSISLCVCVSLCLSLSGIVREQLLGESIKYILSSSSSPHEQRRKERRGASNTTQDHESGNGEVTLLARTQLCRHRYTDIVLHTEHGQWGHGLIGVHVQRALS